MWFAQLVFSRIPTEANTEVISSDRPYSILESCHIQFEDIRDTNLASQTPAPFPRSPNRVYFGSDVDWSQHFWDL